MKLKVLMIHEIREEFLSFDLSGFDVITFDDGLYSQYKYHSHFAKFNKPMYFFITTDFICKENQNKDFISCVEAHKKAFKGDYSNYMTLEQIKELSLKYNIGSHSKTHSDINKIKDIKEQYKKIKEEVDLSLEFFNLNNIRIDSYCLPYNQNNKLYESYIKSKNLKIFSSERIEIESYFGLKSSYCNKN